LMTHSNPYVFMENIYRKINNIHNMEEMLENLLECKLSFEGESKFHYSDEGFIILGEIASIVDSTSLDIVFRQRIIEPLNLIDTYFLPDKGLIARIAPTEECQWRKRLIHGEVHDECAACVNGISGHAGLFSNAKDIAQLGIMMLCSLDNGDFLHKVSAELMCKNYTPGMEQNRGLGWMVAGGCDSPAGDLMSTTSFGHTGFTGTSLWIDPKMKFYAVLLSNHIHPKRNNQGIIRARQIFHNLAVIKYGESLKERLVS